MRLQLSAQIEAAIAALKANPEPTPDQVAKFREIHLELLHQLGDFARDFEQSRHQHPRCIPLWGGAGAAARLYRFLEIGRRRPTAGLGDNVVSLAGGRA